MTIRIDQLVHSYPPHDTPAVDDLTLEVPSGQLFVLLGPSGCGKTSAMRCIAGLETPDDGRIEIDGRPVFDARRGIHVPTHKRNVGMVFQSYAIWPHKTVFENVAFPLRMKGLSAKAAEAKVAAIVAKVGLAGFESRSASNLSGGQMQRVALARSIVMQPSVLLFDEPLSNLDARLRESLRFEIRALQQEFGFTAVYVTHDQGEALALGDRIAVMRAGRIVQQGSPIELYREPNSPFVAEFLGVGNRLPTEVVESGPDGSIVNVLGTGITLRTATAGMRAGDRLLACIRDEEVAVAPETQERRDGVNTLTGRVVVSSFLGGEFHYQCRFDDGPILRGNVPANGLPIPVDTTVTITIPPPAIRLVPATDAELRDAAS